MIAKLSGSLVNGPKFIVPRQSRLTCKPVRPSDVYCMVLSLSSSLFPLRSLWAARHTLGNSAICSPPLWPVRDALHLALYYRSDRTQLVHSPDRPSSKEQLMRRNRTLAMLSLCILVLLSSQSMQAAPTP